MKVGCRVSLITDGGRREGTLAFLGSTNFGRSGSWAGVALDGPFGKHNGTVQGVEYFQCPDRCGVFVRPSALTLVAPGHNGAVSDASESARDTSPSQSSDRVLFKGKARAFTFTAEGQKWASMGTGFIELRQHRENQRVRTLMREDATRRTILNHLVDEKMALEHNSGSDKAWVFRVYNAETRQDDVVAVQFSSAAVAREFAATYDRCRNIMERLSAAAFPPAPPALHPSPGTEARALLRQARLSGGGTAGSNGSSGRRAQRRGTIDTRVGLRDGGAAAAQTDGPRSQRTKKERRGTVTVGGGGLSADTRAYLASLADPPGEHDDPPPSPSTAERHLAEQEGEARLRQRVLSRASNGSVSSGFSDLQKPLGLRAVDVVSATTKKGYAPEISMKPVNQDAMVIDYDPRTDAHLFCVFDGHGQVGHEVSSYFQKRIARRVFSNPKFPSDPGRCLKEAALGVESLMLKASGIDATLSGTTGVLAVVRRGVLTVANIGDSRIVAARRDPAARSGVRACTVSVDHKPDDPKERRRIESRGGRVFAIEYDDDEEGQESPARVWLADANLPGLAMSRSLGDTVAKRAGVISDPQLHVRTLGKEDSFLVLGSDGVFEFIENQEVCDMVQRKLGAGAPTQKAADAAVQALLKESTRRWLRHEPVSDDTTIIVVTLKDA